MEEEIKSLSAWRLELKRLGKSHWLKFYESFMGLPVSSNMRFYRTLNLYGEWALFEAVLAASNADVTGDPLNYVLKIAHNKWKEMQQDEESEIDEQARIEAQKKLSKKKNAELEKKLKRATKTK